MTVQPQIALPFQPTDLADSLPVPAIRSLIYGGDYNPEQWPEAVWLEDARLMQEAGVNLVSLGVFAWAKLEPRPGEYDVAWLDRVIDLLYAHGVRINLATPTASPPPWMAHRYPETLPVTAEGVRLSHGSRRHYCPNSATYRFYAARIVQLLAERYGKHPALALWHIDNEYACHVSECFCDHCAAAFRTWLQTRYTTLTAVNAAWGTAFWGQIYDDWDEIAPPRRTPYMIHPGHLLDWRRFCSDAWLACYEEQRTILKHHTPHIPVTTNFMGFYQPLDYWTWAARGDVVANDSYPDPADPLSPLEGAMQADLMRSLGRGQPWVLMEQVTSHVNWRPQNTTKEPGKMRLGSYQAIARGADGVMFFQWRASQAGGEQFHGAMLPHAGSDSRVWREVVALGAELERLQVVRGSRVRAHVAIVLDWNSWWALESPGKPTADIRLMEQIRAWYAVLYAQGITVDFVHPEADLSAYTLLLAPNLYLVSDPAVQALEQFVAHGGTLVLGGFSGIVNAQSQVRLGGYPAPWRAMLGLRVEEFAPFPAGGTTLIATEDEEEIIGTIQAEVIHLEGAEQLAFFTAGFYAGGAAVTRNRFGAGQAYYVGTHLDDHGMRWLLDHACTSAAIKAERDPIPGVEYLRRTSGTRSWLFALNHNPVAVRVPLALNEYDVLGGLVEDQCLLLPAYGVAVLTS